MPQVNLNLVSPKFPRIQLFSFLFFYSEFTELIFFARFNFHFGDRILCQEIPNRPRQVSAC
jgi:hypothetical protein